ncbi:MAG TPA: hypothetical protein DDW76_22390 [Cyanobacteria bacterium UBA11369]|nr:hypothetical protein [Cyanobacteria bacterium UBA11371]HBE32854.1 hypothetical protein [Cyanobacteria bacterium UBA11368]HBE51449.1 hypothetical protein [Cyanobacteria bacterium UBA11369]
MKLSQANLSQIYSEHLWLELSDSDLELARPNPKNYSNDTGRNYAFFNRLCLNAFLHWCQENLELAPSVFPNEEVLPMLWEFFTGCGINLYGKRLVLIPTDAIDMADFAVPQEWVDIPNLAADYYLPVRIDIENRSLHFWGFVSRRTLKAKADFDSIYRLYYVEGDWVIPNLEMLEGASNLRDEKGQVAPLVTLSNVEDLIAQLSEPSPYSPRLKAKFEKWGALLNESRWLQQLYEGRTGCPSHKKDLAVVFNLSMWLDGIVEAGWQTFDEWFNTNKMPAFRAKQVRGIELETPEKVKRAVRQLRNSQSDVDFPTDIEDREALVHLLQHTHDETVRWKAVEYLWTIDPNYPNPALRRVMDLGVQLMGHPIALMIAVLRKLDGRIAVLLRAYPMGGQTKLPPDLQLIALDENGDPIPRLEAVSRSQPLDDYIALYFTADVGDRFSVCLTLEDTSITEQFVV